MRRNTQKYAKINGKKYKYNCSCKQHTLDCVTPDMWDAASIQLFSKRRKRRS